MMRSCLVVGVMRKEKKKEKKKSANYVHYNFISLSKLYIIQDIRI